ncbi:MAG: hypothetical protein LBJ08_06750 [Bifidobacteriaceae bacterium]|jgi:hypothetical protein|nr:hypothetical protein [Bifidobacteriaceae bacterium]
MKYRPFRPEAQSDRGTSLAELLIVIAVGTAVLGLLAVVSFSLTKHDGLNLARQERVDGIQKASVWLGDALANAASNPESPNGAVFEVANHKKMTFTSALPVQGLSEPGLVVRVTIVLGEECWTGDPGEPNTLRRCVQRPEIALDGTKTFCDWAHPGCSEALFEDIVLARNVQQDALFSYALQTNAGVGSTVSSVTGDDQLMQITAVELRVAVKGTPGSQSADTATTVFRRHAIKGWSKQ